MSALGGAIKVLDVVDDGFGSALNGLDFINDRLGGILSNVTLLSMLLLSLKDKPFPKTSQTFKKEYDYIIVGAGTAGSVMANRLSEIPWIEVLLIEAGGDAPILSEVPAFARLEYETNIDWLYMTVPQKYGAYGHVDNKVKINNGRALGGTSVLNAMLYVRGNKKNYDDWEADGATGWSYKDVLPYFLKLEDNTNIKELDPDFHQRGGPLTVEKPNYTPEIKNPVLEALAGLGFAQTDINGRRQTGIWDLQASMRNQQRCSTAKAYLVPAEDRPNLTILKRAFANKILFHGNKVIGVEFDFRGATHKVFARREVIVSTGAIRAPQLLMLSGIGPKKHLEKFNIPVIADLPVGKNLQDHNAASLVYELDPTIMNVILKDLNPVNILNYITNREGPLTAPNQCTVLAFLDGLNTTATSKDFPRQELYWAEYSVLDALRNSNLKTEVYTEVFGKYLLHPLYICLSSLLQPASRGEILLSSTNPRDYPLIDPRYYEEDQDLKDVVEGLRICDAVATSKAMQKVKSKPIDANYPGCEKFIGNQTATYECIARTITNTFWHLVGTCKMGKPDDPRSVVDPSLRVIGVESLRVVCAAVMPIVPSGNTNVPTMMVAEKIADEMKKEIISERRKAKAKYVS